MTTPADWVTRVRDELYGVAEAHKALERRVDDLQAEVAALGGAASIFGAQGENWPTQGDGLEQSDLTTAFGNIDSLVGNPTLEQKQSVICCRRN